MSAQEQKKSIGGIWIKTARNGSEYLSIKIGDKNFVAFQNRKKDGSNQPDYYIPEPMDGQRPQHREDLTASIQPRQEQQSNVMDEEVPF